MDSQSAFVEALLDARQPCPSTLRAWNQSDPEQRFAVYRNNVVVSLVEALVATFPVCLDLVGKSFFRAMAREFVVARPPRSQILTFYGREFPAFIDHFAPAASVPYLADMARLESLRVDAYHSADVEPLATSRIAGLLSRPEGLPGLRFDVHPSTAVLHSPYAVVSFWMAHQQAPVDLTGIDPQQPQTALVQRAGLDVQVMEVTTGIGVFIDHLMAGACLAQAGQSASASDHDFDLAAALTLLIQCQMITALYPGDQHGQRDGNPTP